MKRILQILLAGMVAQTVWAATGTMIRDDELRSSPSVGAARVASVEKGTGVEVLARQGGWTQIRAGKRTGWVRILSVRGTASTASAADLAALASRRDGSQVVAVAGLRGLSEEELKTAKFNAQELSLLDAQASSAEDARTFARSADLASRKLSYLPAPQPESSGGDTGQGWSFGK